jgi:SAM-dependent methyltransferase
MRDAAARSIERHYGSRGLGERLLAALEEAGKPAGSVVRDDLAALDEFHIGGREATRDLARLAGIGEGDRVIDIGCGIGGPARTLAAEFGCVVTGIDVVAEYVRAAEMLAALVGLDDRVSFRRGDAAALLPGEGRYDVAWTQHVTMNVEDKAGLFGRIRELIRPGGRYVFHEVCRGTVAPVHFPVPWANDADISFLVPAEEFRDALSASGLRPRAWEDVSARSLGWFRGMLEAAGRRSPDGPPPPGLHLLMGPTAGRKMSNVVRNLEEDRIRVVRGVFTREP